MSIPQDERKTNYMDNRKQESRKKESREVSREGCGRNEKTHWKLQDFHQSEKKNDVISINDFYTLRIWILYISKRTRGSSIHRRVFVINSCMGFGYVEFVSKLQEL